MVDGTDHSRESDRTVGRDGWSGLVFIRTLSGEVGVNMTRLFRALRKFVFRFSFSKPGLSLISTQGGVSFFFFGLR